MRNIIVDLHSQKMWFDFIGLVSNNAHAQILSFGSRVTHEQVSSGKDCI